jgi:hypothetical protein
MRPDSDRRHGNVALAAALVAVTAAAAILLWFVVSTGGVTAL